MHLAISKEWRSLSLRGAKQNELKMGCKSRSASDYSRENYDLVMETIKGKPELVCKPRCIIILIKKSPLCNLKMLSNTRNKIWTSYFFITNFQLAVNKEKSSPSSFWKTNYNKNLFLQALHFFLFCFFFNQTKNKAKAVRDQSWKKRNYYAAFWNTNISGSSCFSCLATHPR